MNRAQGCIFKLNEKQLRRNFQKEVLDHNDDAVFMNDEGFRKTMFASFVQEEEAASKLYPGPYKQVAQELDIPLPSDNFEASNSQPDLSGIRTQNDQYLGRNQQVPETYQSPKSAPPNPTYGEYPRTTKADDSWRQPVSPKLNRAQKVARSAIWMSPEEQAAFQVEINSYIKLQEQQYPPEIHNIPKDQSYYEKPDVVIRSEPSLLGLSRRGKGPSFADQAKLDQNILESNGCGGSGVASLVPDNSYYGSYKEACNLHDTLYGIPNMPKERSDEIFNQALQDVLRNSPIYNGPIPTEHLYTKGVRRLKFADAAYEEAQRVGKRSWNSGWHPLQK